MNDETVDYNEKLEKHLANDIDFSANTIKNADQGDLEQLAADSFFKGWQEAKEYFSKA